MQLLKHTRGLLAPALSINANFVIDYLRVLGPARERLRRRYSGDLRDYMAALAQPYDEVMRVGLASDTGTRPRNEDSAVALMAHLDDSHMPIPLLLMAVADGIGGSADGELAGALAIQTLVDCVVGRMVDVGDQQWGMALDALSVESLLVEAFGLAHHRIRRRTSGGGSTLTCALVIDRTAYVAHVGDSRAVLFGPDPAQVETLTRDHRFVREWEELGIISHEEAASHPQAHILYRSLGKLDQVEVDLTRRTLVEGSRLLLCSDGIWETVGAQQMASVVHRASHPQNACEALLTAALAGDAHDDITATLVGIPPER